MEGWLIKARKNSSSSALFSTRRWFSLDLGNGILVWRESQHGRALGSEDLGGACVEHPTPFAFEVIFASGRRDELRAESSAVAANWVAAVRSAARHAASPLPLGGAVSGAVPPPRTKRTSFLESVLHGSGSVMSVAARDPELTSSHRASTRGSLSGPRPRPTTDGLAARDGPGASGDGPARSGGCFPVLKTNRWGKEQRRLVEVIGGLVLRNTDRSGRVKREMPLSQVGAVERSLGEPRQITLRWVDHDARASGVSGGAARRAGRRYTLLFDSTEDADRFDELLRSAASASHLGRLGGGDGAHATALWRRRTRRGARDPDWREWTSGGGARGGSLELRVRVCTWNVGNKQPSRAASRDLHRAS